MNDCSYETFQKNFENQVKNEEIKPFYSKRMKKNYSNKVESWYLEKTKEGKFVMEYFSSVEERLHFFRRCKEFKPSLKGIDKIIKDLILSKTTQEVK